MELPGGCQPFGPDDGDVSPARASFQIFAKVFQGRARTFGCHFNVSLISITDPAGELQQRSFVLRVISKANALDLPLNDRMQTDDRIIHKIIYWL